MHVCVCVCSLRVSASLERVLLAVPLLCERVPAHNACACVCEGERATNVSTFGL